MRCEWCDTRTRTLTATLMRYNTNRQYYSILYILRSITHRGRRRRRGSPSAVYIGVGMESIILRAG